MGGIRLYVLVIFSVLLSGLAAMLPFAWSGADVLSSSYHEAAIKDMEANARLFSLALASRVENKSRTELQALAKTARADTGNRYTLILKDGTVAADSDEDPARMENHGNRTEIQTALSGKTGIEVRSSPTLESEWVYVAVPLEDGSVVRAAGLIEELNSKLAQWWKKALPGLTLSGAILLALSLIAARKLSRPLEEAASGVGRFAHGDFEHRLSVSGSSEMRKLSSSINGMADELNSRFMTISRQKEKMRVVFENMSEGVLAVDDNGKVLLMNSTAEQFLGLSKDVSGVGLETVARNPDLLDIIRETVATGSPVERDIRITRGDEEALMQVHTVRVSEKSGSLGVLAVLRDVTRLRHLEIMRRDFVANVSHELRTPITAIRSSIETILEDGVDDKKATAEFLEMALKNTKRIGSIIDNLLFLAGMESGAKKDTGKIGPHPVRPVLDESVTVCKEAAADRKIAFSINCGAEVLAQMNPPLIVHAVVNLLDNAIKYGPEGGTVTISAHQEDNQVAIIVSDQGQGIPPRFQSRVFERFYRVDGSDRIKKGSGLGLSIVKHIALSQGGDIQVKSEIGAGSRFILTLPSAKTKDAPDQTA